MDIDNYIAYQLSQIYFRNTDWPQNNIRYYRVKQDYNPDANPPFDGRWRWLLFDTDHGFTFRGSDSYQHNTLEYASREDHWSTYLFRNLLKNENFKFQFITEFADHLNTTFNSQRVINEIKIKKNTFEPEIEEHIYRWNRPNSIERWHQEIKNMENFASKRPDHVREHLIEKFNLEGIVNLNIISDSNAGHIQVNSILLDESTPGINNLENWSGIYFKNVPITVTAIPAEGYTFKGWKHAEMADTIELILDSDFTLEPIFEKK